MKRRGFKVGDKVKYTFGYAPHKIVRIDSVNTPNGTALLYHLDNGDRNLYGYCLEFYEDGKGK